MGKECVWGRWVKGREDGIRGKKGENELETQQKKVDNQEEMRWMRTHRRWWGGWQWRERWREGEREEKGAQ